MDVGSTEARRARARAVAEAGGVDAARARGTLPGRIDTTLVEALVLGLLRQGVRTFAAVFGHGSTELGECLRVYEEAGALRTFGMRSEIEASHAAAALRRLTGEKAAVITSIGPGALQAMAASLVAASDGIGVWYLLGDETTEDEGPNMQQIPRHEQGLFLRLFAAMGEAYSLHTPLALGTALRRGLAAVEHPFRPGPFYLLMPMNTQPARLPAFNLDELPGGELPRLAAAPDDGRYAEAARALMAARRVVIKVGGGGIGAGPQIERVADLCEGVVVHTPIATGVLPAAHPRNMGVGGSKGSICGNFAMEEADALLAVGTRAVCQSDSSRTGYPKVEHVVAVNADLRDAIHYGGAVALVGDAAATLDRLARAMEALPRKEPTGWAEATAARKAEWAAYRAERYACPTLPDPVWGGPVLTQPAAIKAATDWARSRGVVSFFDAGDVQAHGFQIVEDERVGQTFTETGASYMGFAASAVLATAMAGRPFRALALTGDGSFLMNPQILVDGVAHGARGTVLILDNRRMAAISGLQVAQHGHDYATWDHVPVDWVAVAGAVRGVKALDGGRSVESLVAALEEAHGHEGLSVVHVPVYWGPDPRGGLGAFGRWNVGNWVESTQGMRHDIGR